MDTEQKIMELLDKKEFREGLATYKIAAMVGLSYPLGKIVLENMASKRKITKITTPVRTTYWRIR